MKKAILPAAILAATSVHAHCPLCTIGAAAAAGGAMYLGVNQAAIGVFIGAFAVSTGWWVSKMLKKRIKYQRELLIAASFLLTIIPMLPMMKEVYPVYISLLGGYGTLLNRTYVLSPFLVGSIIGGVIVTISPWLSKKLTSWRGKKLPYQGLALTFTCLFLLAVLFQVML